jgi:hypothetical protein
MINEQEYDLLVNELNKIVSLPTGWGGQRQNNYDDDKIDLFSINSYDKLLVQIASFSKDKQEYYIKRWFVIKVSDCDEYLISILPDASKNPDKYSKKFDFILKGHKFDVKGTRVPFKFKDNLNSAYTDPQKIIDFYYSEQSTDRRFGVQNRLFIVTVDEGNFFEEWRLRRDFISKKKAFIEYMGKLTPNRKFFKVNFNGKELMSDIIFVIKRKDEINIIIASDNIN